MPRTSTRGAVAAIGSVSLAVGVVSGVPLLLHGDGSGPGPDTAAAAARTKPAATPTSTPPGHLMEFDAGLPQRLQPKVTTRIRRHRHHHHKAPVHRAPVQASRSSARPVISSDPRSIARAMVAARGWSYTQFQCLDLLWTKESDWQVHNMNASSGSYGIPQALPADKMAAFGSDWRDNPVTQIRWGLWYIGDRYGTPCAAWAHSQAYNFY